MKVFLSVVALEPDVGDQSLVEEGSLYVFHPLQNKVSGALFLPVRANVYVHILIERLRRPIIYAAEQDLGRLRLGPPYPTHGGLHGTEGDGLG